ncbi:hypothetical protein [Bergeyella sp. RCAD1439]|uniref:hypothetical protein n=1 Tax=Bergeyella anatis TaxID=3113737 RepID=UPI002E18CB63|nr:hypothetical protein [Bergeyella sp. RCAD1439]
MAGEFQITPAVYRKIETGAIKLFLERCFKIAGVMEAYYTDLLELAKEALSRNTPNDENGFRQKMDNLYQENKNVHKALPKSKILR